MPVEAPSEGRGFFFSACRCEKRIRYLRSQNGPHRCGPFRSGVVLAGRRYSFAALRSSSALSVFSHEKAVAVWVLPSAPV